MYFVSARWQMNIGRWIQTIIPQMREKAKRFTGENQSLEDEEIIQRSCSMREERHLPGGSYMNPYRNKKTKWEVLIPWSKRDTYLEVLIPWRLRGLSWKPGFHLRKSDTYLEVGAPWRKMDIYLAVLIPWRKRDTYLEVWIPQRKSDT